MCFVYISKSLSGIFSASYNGRNFEKYSISLYVNEDLNSPILTWKPIRIVQA